MKRTKRLTRNDKRQARMIARVGAAWETASPLQRAEFLLKQGQIISQTQFDAVTRQLRKDAAKDGVVVQL